MHHKLFSLSQWQKVSERLNSMASESMNFKSKRRGVKSSNRYLKPGALAQLRYNLSTSRSCTDIRKKRVVLYSKDKKFIRKKRIILEPVEEKMDPCKSCKANDFKSPTGPDHAFRQIILHESPRTPSRADTDCYSRLESLPIELLVKILCHLHHDQLRAVFHVSQRVRSAVIIARQTYFNYTTPDRSRLEMLRIQTPLPTECWPFTSGRLRLSGPITPKAPRHGPCPPRFHLLEIKQVAAVLFQDSTLPSNCMVLPKLPKQVLKPLASNRVLFYEDELCKAVAQNKLR